MKIDKYPAFICPNCGTIKKLDFHPKSSFEKWKNFKCGVCGYQPYTSSIGELFQG